MRPIRFLVVTALFACQGRTALPPEVAENYCRVNAVTSVLPDDVDQLSVADLKDIHARLKSCKQPDGGP